MYVDKSTTGINIMDLNHRECLMIQDSLRRALFHCILSNDEKATIDNLQSKIMVGIEGLAPGTYKSKINGDKL